MSCLFVNSKGQAILICQRRKKYFHVANSEEMLYYYCFNCYYRISLYSVVAIKLALPIHI